MKNLFIHNFKGIKGPLELSFRDSSGNNLNCLLYSENGGGKTSIAEAIRICVCYKAWEDRNIQKNLADQNREQAIKSQLAKYLHDGALASYKIRINEVIETSNLSPDCRVDMPDFFILGRHELIPSSRIDLTSLLSSYNIRLSSSINGYLTEDNINLIIDEVNRVLKDVFKEDISIVRLQESGIFIGIHGITGQGHVGEGIHSILNEARQNLIKVLLFLSFLRCLPPSQEKDDKCVVLDDIMSSLDLENRIILARYLVDYGRDYQMVIMTHNIGFFNLMCHTVKIEEVTQDWKFVSLYRIDGQEELVDPAMSESVKDLETRYGGKIRPGQSDAINAMRRKLEFLLHEFGKILTLGIQEETKDLIGHLVSAQEKGYYCCIEGDNIKTGVDLINNSSFGFRIKS